MDATKAIMFTGAAGLAGVLLLALPDILPPAVAGEEPMRTLLSSPNELWPPAFNPKGLMKWDYYVQPGVSVEPVRESTVRKIGYGKTTFVNVMETPSGVYSSDALASPNIEYPGIVKELKTVTLPVLRLWDGEQWVVAAAADAKSFVTITPINGGTLTTGEDGNCAVVGETTYC
jgi:hypothetical protein